MNSNKSPSEPLFIGRKDELAQLERLYERSREGLIVACLSGHRRVGKTTLVNHFGRSRDSLYFFVSPKTEPELVASLLKAVKREMPVPDYIDFRNLASLLEFIFDNFEGLVTLDEFQNLARVNRSILSDIQNLVDSGKGKKILLVLCGSYVGMMKRIFHDEHEPLFGRLDAEIRLRPFGIREVMEYLAAMGFEDMEKMIALYTIFGGTPFYYALMRKLNVRGDLRDILGEMFFNPYTLLKDEVRNILTLEFGGAKDICYSILEAISLGHRRAGEIAKYTGYRSTSLSPYIADLLNYYEYISRSVPVTARSNRRTKTSRYAVTDPMMSFWFRFIYRNISEMESGMFEYLLDRTMDELPLYIGKQMEGVVGELLKARKDEILPFRPNRIGNWWNRQGKEIDLIAMDDRHKRICFVEIKWRNRKTGYNTVNDLLEKAGFVQGYNDYERYFLIVSKAGFTRSALSRIELEKMMHWNLDDVAKLL